VRPPQVNLQHIITFYFVAREESFSSASEKLCITEPAVHQQIRGLELHYGIKLIYVKKKRAHLTKAGEKLLSYAEILFNHAIATENFLKSYRVSNLHVGIAGTLVVYLMGIIDKFKELYPTVQVIIRQGPSGVLAEELAHFRHDICLVGSLPHVDEGLRVLRIPEVERMVFVTSPEHPLAGGPAATWEDLAHYPLIIQHEGSCAREIVHRHFASRHLEPFVGAEIDNVECAKGLARQNKGIALMFLPNVKEELTLGSLRIIPVVDGDIRLGIDIIMNREAGLSPVMEAFLTVVRQHFNYEPSQIAS
jgi:DNA-binding transcriptional LysR family regulator